MEIELGEHGMEVATRFGCEVIGEDRLEIRMFVLADWATIPPDGKLYVGGAGISSVRIEPLPGALPPLHLVVRVRVPNVPAGE